MANHSKKIMTKIPVCVQKIARLVLVWITSLVMTLGSVSQVHAFDGAVVSMDRMGFPEVAQEETDFMGFSVPSRIHRDGDSGYRRAYAVDITSYTSSVEECDSDPFITADGSETGDGIIAANFLPFGTKIRIPDYFGNKVFTVHDRMNARYWYRIDVWMKEKKDMRAFGIKKNAKIELVELGDGKTQWAARAAEIKAKRIAEAKK